MGRAANPALASLWRSHVERQRRSGLSIVEYCRREGFSAANFHAWKRRLRASHVPVQKNSNRPGPQRAVVSDSPRGGFLRVPLAVERPIEVRFGDGTVVNVPAEQLAALALTLKILKGSQLEGEGDD